MWPGKEAEILKMAAKYQTEQEEVEEEDERQNVTRFESWLMMMMNSRRCYM